MTVNRKMDIKDLVSDSNADVIEAIQKNLEILKVPVQKIESHTITYNISGIQTGIFQMAKIIRMFKQAQITYKPEQKIIEFTVSFTKLLFISLFLFIAMSSFFCLLTQSFYGMIPGLFFSLFIYFGNFFYGIFSFKLFIRKSIQGKKMILK